MRWDECQRLKQHERGGKEGQELEDDDSQGWIAAFESAAKRMLRYLEDSETLKGSTRELKEQVLSPEEPGDSIFQIAIQARNEIGKKLFQIVRQGASEVHIASMARWDAHLKGPVVPERRSSELKEDVEFFSERQEVLVGLMEGKVNMQSEAPEKYFEKIFEEVKELE